MRRRRSALALVAALGLLVAVTASPAAAAPAGVFRLTLTGEEEATPTCEPPNCGDPDAVGQAVLVVIPNADMVCFAARWTGIDGTVFGAHIHEAPVGDPGPVVIPLFAGAFDGTDMTRGCVSANGEADDILANPENYYINIHSTPNFPGGAIRAQLA